MMMKRSEMIFAGSIFVLGLLAAAAMGCAGPSKARLKVLLHQCREHNREAQRLVVEYKHMDCKAHPEQRAGTAGFDDAGF